jgi:hypothetical protein
MGGHDRERRAPGSAAVPTLDALEADAWRFQVDLRVKKPDVHLPFEHTFDPAGTDPAQLQDKGRPHFHSQEAAQFRSTLLFKEL